MLKARDIVKINFEELMEDTLTADSNINKRDYLTYLKSNPDKKYSIKIVDCITPCPYILLDDFLKDTSFAEEELIKCE